MGLSGWNENSLDSNFSPHTKIKSTGKGIYIGKYKIQHKFIFVYNFSYDSKENCIKHYKTVLVGF